MGVVKAEYFLSSSCSGMLKKPEVRSIVLNKEFPPSAAKPGGGEGEHLSGSSCSTSESLYRYGDLHSISTQEPREMHIHWLTS